MTPARPAKRRIRNPRENGRGSPKPEDFTARGTVAASRATPELFRHAVFVASVHDPGDLPRAGPPEIAFVGRSNVGKSSAINALAGRRRLAFVSKTPGRTQLINFFALGSEGFLVDLPGYGYAGVPAAVQAHWDALVGGYVAERASLALVVVVMDIRHPLTPLDLRLLDWLRNAGRRAHVLLAKADKLSAQAGRRTLDAARARLAEAYPGTTVQLFSSLRRSGIDEASRILGATLGQRTISEPQKNKSPG